MANLKKKLTVQLLLGATRCSKRNSATLVENIQKFDFIHAST